MKRGTAGILSMLTGSIKISVTEWENKTASMEIKVPDIKDKEFLRKIEVTITDQSGRGYVTNCKDILKNNT